MKISQKTLEDILQRRAAIDAAQKELEAVEAEVFDALKKKAQVAPGLFIAEIKVTSRRSPSWKECCIREIDKIRGDGEGIKFTERVLAGTKESVMEKLSVKIAA